MPETTIDLAALVLAKGSHPSRQDGVCLMEAAAWLAGLEHTDHPPCVSPVLGKFGRTLNDVLPDDTRQQLKPLIPWLPGTADDGRDQARGFLAMDWLIRTWLPSWLDLAGLADDAAALQELSQITSLETLEDGMPVLRRARDSAAAAGAAARDAAWAAAGAAAGDDAWGAAGAAARDAAWAAARAAARAAAGDDAWGDAWGAAWAAAWDAAWDAAWGAAGDAARGAARDKLAPTVAILQADAIRLFRIMIDGTADV